jgi:hypothetical protein
MFERTLSDFYFQRWLEHLPEAARPEAVAHARQLALRHGNLTAAATLLLRLGDAAAAEDRLPAEPGRIDGHAIDTSSPAASPWRASSSATDEGGGRRTDRMADNGQRAATTVFRPLSAIGFSSLPLNCFAPS